MITSTLTSKGQTTIPRKVREALHLKPHQRLTYDIHGDQVILKPLGPTILDLFGSVKSPARAPSEWKEIEKIAHKATAVNSQSKRKGK